MAGQILHDLSHRNTVGFHVAAAGAAREELMRLGFASWKHTARWRLGGKSGRLFVMSLMENVPPCF